MMSMSAYSVALNGAKRHGVGTPLPVATVAIVADSRDAPKRPCEFVALCARFSLYYFLDFLVVKLILDGGRT